MHQKNNFFKNLKIFKKVLECADRVELQNNYNIVLEAVKIYGFAFQYASEKLQKNHIIILEIYKNIINEYGLYFIEEYNFIEKYNLRNNYIFILAVVKNE